MSPRSSKHLSREVSSALALKLPRIKRLGSIGDLEIFLTSGEYIRNHIDLDYTAGGNFGAYPRYVPRNEIWIDDALHAFDRVATIFHEIIERNLMLNGGIDYDDAHDIACKREAILRKQMMRRPPRSVDLRLVAAALEPHAGEAIATGKKPGRPSR